MVGDGSPLAGSGAPRPGPSRAPPGGACHGPSAPQRLEEVASRPHGIITLPLDTSMRHSTAPLPWPPELRARAVFSIVSRREPISSPIVGSGVAPATSATPGMPVFPVRTAFRIALDTEIADRNLQDGRNFAAAFLSVANARERILSHLGAVPEKLESLLNHPDERVSVALLRSRHRQGVDPLVLRAFTARALEDATSDGVLWTPTLDALAGRRPHDMSLDEAPLTPLEQRATELLAALAQSDSADSLERLAASSSWLITHWAAGSAQLTAPVVRRLLRRVRGARQAERLLWTILVGNATLPQAARSALVAHLVDTLTGQAVDKYVRFSRGAMLTDRLADAVEGGLALVSDDVRAIADALVNVTAQLPGFRWYGVDRLLVAAVSAPGAHVAPGAFGSLARSGSPSLSELGLELVAQVNLAPQPRP
jgi:hypothetical protein